MFILYHVIADLKQQLGIIKKLNKLAENCMNMAKLYDSYGAGFIMLPSNNWK